MSTAAALRQAQMDAIESPQAINSAPKQWAAFATLGGYAEF